MLNQHFMAQLKVANVELVGESDRLIDKVVRRFIIGCRNSAGIQVRGTDKETTEQTAADGYQRQPPHRTAAANRLQRLRPVSQSALENVEPSRVDTVSFEKTQDQLPRFDGVTRLFASFGIDGHGDARR